MKAEISTSKTTTNLTKTPAVSSSRRFAVLGILILFLILSGYFMFKPKASSVTIPNSQTVGSASPVKDSVEAPPAKKTIAEQPVKEKPVIKKERLSPARYLVKTVKMRKNFVGQTVIEGSIKNVSTTGIYKDIVLNVEYRSKTGSTISAQRFVVYEIAKPNKRIPFKFKIRAPFGTVNCSAEIVDAIVVN